MIVYFVAVFFTISRGAKDSQGGVLSILHLPKDQNEWSFTYAQLHAFEIHCDFDCGKFWGKYILYIHPMQGGVYVL